MLSLWNDPVFRLFDDMMGATLGASTSVRAFTPTVDVRTDDSSIRYELDVPGVKLDDLDIELENGVLTVSGERRFSARDGKDQRVMLGRAYGRFSQSFAVPEWADVDKLEARLEEGVLSIVIPKRESARPRKIQILGASNGSGKQLTEGDAK